MSDVAYRTVTTLAQLGDVTLSSPSTGQALTYNSGTGKWVNTTITSGTVTSVGLAAPAIFSVSGSPVTSSGTLTLTLATQAANLVWAGPTSGGAATPSFRALVAADLPTGSGPYFVLAGVAGGQTGYGDTASGGNLTLGSTANATKGKILLGASSAYDEVNVRLGVGTTSPSTVGHMALADSATTTNVSILTLSHTSSGTPGAGFGSGISFQLQSSTTTGRDAARVVSSWATATDASRKARLVLLVSDSTTEREGFRVESDGTYALKSFSGNTPTANIYSSGLAQPASVSSTPGTAATAEVSITGGTGGNTTIATTGTGGAGAALTFFGGTGGQATAATTASTGGTGGSASFVGGAGAAATVVGSGTNTGGVGGAVSISGGAGGAASGGAINNGGNGGQGSLTGGPAGVGGSTPGNGGTALVQGGLAAAAAGSSGGTLQLFGRDGSTTGSGGNGGGIQILAGNAGGDNTVDRGGGAVSITAGNAKGSFIGGAISVTAGTGGPGTGTAGAVGGVITISGGVGGVGSATGGAGGAVTLQGGTAAAAVGSAGGAASLLGRAGSSTGSGGTGGAVTITAGNAGGDNTVNRAGGAITVTAGNSKGSSTGAAISITAGAGGVGTGTTGATGGAITITAGLGGDGSGTDGAGGALIFQTADTLTATTRLTIAATGAATYTGGSVTTQTAFTINTGADGNGGLLIAGNSTNQSGNLLVVNKSSGAPVLSVDGNGVFGATTRDAATTTSAYFYFTHNTSGAINNNFGTCLRLRAQTSTTPDTDLALIDARWYDITHATRKSSMAFYCYDNTTNRLALVLATSGSAAMIGFLGATAVAQQNTTGTSTGFTAGAGTHVLDDSTFTGGTGATAYRISDIVLALKNYGLLAS